MIAGKNAQGAPAYVICQAPEPGVSIKPAPRCELFTVDATTGTIKLKGTFTNDANLLWPGQFVRVALRLTTHANALVVPNQAVQAGQDDTANLLVIITSVVCVTVLVAANKLTPNRNPQR